jgi:acetyltransferase-like isoleucine patch superfamily enzyme
MAPPANPSPSSPAARVEALRTRGVRVLDPGQTFVDEDVDPTRVDPTATLYPGTRLHGRRTFLGAGASVGLEGPATLVDSVLGEGASIASGFAKGAVLLKAAKLGANAHVREGTILEEEASTAHAVGLKQTILLSFVTLGSLINFCDLLMAGGTSREDHSEVGSGFIHFNFTPWGRAGDKATPSLVGDVVSGVFLRQRRIFLGGQSGLVGPRSVGFGSMTGAGQVVRRDVGPGRLAIQVARATDEPLERPLDLRVQPVVDKNIEYIAQLRALEAFYREVRLGRARRIGRADLVIVYEAAIANLAVCLAERVSRLKSFLREHTQARDGRSLPDLQRVVIPACPLRLDADGDAAAADAASDHVSWIQALPDAEVERGHAWLHSIARAVRETLTVAPV